MIDSATLTMWGNVVAEPRVTGLADNPDRVAFRILSNRRKRDPQTGEWVPAGEYGMNVVCWRRLARGVAQSVHKGDPVLVIGRVTERQYVGGDGEPRWHTELTADFVGPDLSYGIAGRFTRFTQLDRVSGRDADAATAGGAGIGGPTGGLDGADDTADADGTAGQQRDADFAPSTDPAVSADFTDADREVLDGAAPEPAVF